MKQYRRIKHQSINYEMLLNTPHTPYPCQKGITTQAYKDFLLAHNLYEVVTSKDGNTGFIPEMIIKNAQNRIKTYYADAVQPKGETVLETIFS